MSNTQCKSDDKIVSMIALKQRIGWECLYDKYSSSLYGVIYLMSKDKSIAEDILCNFFLFLNKNIDILVTKNASLCPFLMQEAFVFTRNELKERGLDADISTLSDKPKFLQLLCAKYCC